MKYRLSLTALLLLAHCACAQTPPAPGAGGYNGDFGSDYGVGKKKVISRREPAIVVGFKVRTESGRIIPWAGIRFAELLSQRLAPVLGRAPSSGDAAKELAERGLRSYDVDAATEEADVASLWSVRALRSDAALKSHKGLLVLGDIMVRGVSSDLRPEAQADLFTRRGTSLTVRLRVLRNRPEYVVVASHIITLRAPAQEWAQLPARVALALLDEIKVKLSDDQRSELLRDASPLMPNASSSRLRADARLGTAIALALECQIVRFNLPKIKGGPARAAAARSAVAGGRAAQRDLAQLLQLQAKPTPQDGNAARGIRDTAVSWQGYATSVTAQAQKDLTRMSVKPR